MVVEPAGAAAVAALLEHPTAFPTPAVAVLSGGNIDPLLLGKVIRHGMAAAGRYLNLRVCIPDVPGGLAQLLAEISAVGANVLEVVARADLARRCTSTRSRCTSSSRPAASRTPSRCSPASASAATASSSNAESAQSHPGRETAPTRGDLRRLGEVSR